MKARRNLQSPAKVSFGLKSRSQQHSSPVIAVREKINDDARVNAWGGAIALGHPLGASGARLATTAINRLHATGGRYALCTMCIGVGQGIALILERV